MFKESIYRGKRVLITGHTGFKGFWQCMDTARDLKYLEDVWQTGRAPWKTW